MLGDFATKFWPENWEDQLIAAVEQQGHTSVSSYLAANPACGYRNLCSRLGAKTVPYMLRRIQFQEANHIGLLRNAVIDSVIRLMHDIVPVGWMSYSDCTPGAREAGVFATLTGDLQQFGLPVSDLFTACANAIFDSKPPVGWLPTSHADPVLQSAFDLRWPTEGTAVVHSE